MKYLILKLITLQMLLYGQSEAQMQEIKKLAKNKGFTENQIQNTLKKNKSFKSQDFNKQEEIIEEIALPSQEQSIQIVEDEIIKKNDNLDKKKVKIEALDDQLKKVEKKSTILEEDTGYFFGYDIFKKDPSLFQTTSFGVVDPSYLIGPGDEIIIMLWGETQFRQVFSVDREGFVFIPEIGQVFVNGLNLNLLESKLFRVFSQSYASLNPQAGVPTTFLDVSLGNLRPLRIQVLGEVSQPGAYTVSPSTTLFSSLYYFNGPTTLGSLRDIRLIRGEEKIATIDFYDYLLTGKKPQDLKLQLDDIVFIPPRLKTVVIEGEINRSGIYELKEEESLLDLLSIAGGLKITAYLERSQIDRIVPFSDREQLGMERMYVDVNLEQVLKSKNKFILQDGDRIEVFSVLDSRLNAVDLIGSVTRPGRYDLGDSMTISQLINKADGLLGDAYLERADIIRLKPDFTEELIKVNLKDALIGNLKDNIDLQGSDRVQVYGKSEMVPKTYLSIFGHVKNPGKYPIQENITLYDLIFKAGGFLDEEFKKRTYLKRAELIRAHKNTNEKEIIPFNLEQVLNKKGKAHVPLKADDLVRIYSIAEIQGTTRYVSINGHVKNPGRYELFEGNMRIYDLLFRAGGFDDPLFKSKAFLGRADLIRFEKNQTSQFVIPFHLDSVLTDKMNKQNILLLPEDRIRIYSENTFNTVSNVIINGDVRKPGSYKLKSKMTLKDLILEADGLKDNIFRYRVEIARINPINDNLDQYAKVITFDINHKFRILNKEDTHMLKSVSLNDSTFYLRPFDLVSIRKDPYFSKQKIVSVKGEVLYPGEYVILSSEEKITDIIFRAGGLRPSAFLMGTEYLRDGIKIKSSFKKIIKNPKSNLNFNVQGGDEIIIKSKPNLVIMKGQVNSPGIHKYIHGKRLKYYLNLAGGLSPDGDISNIWVEYPDGESKKYKNIFSLSPKISDGSIIIVGKKKEEEPFDKTEFAKELTSIIANLAQTLTIIMIAKQ